MREGGAAAALFDGALNGDWEDLLGGLLGSDFVRG
jgi:hypothetical protein